MSATGCCLLARGLAAVLSTDSPARLTICASFCFQRKSYIYIRIIYICIYIYALYIPVALLWARIDVIQNNCGNLDGGVEISSPVLKYPFGPPKPKLNQVPERISHLF